MIADDQKLEEVLGGLHGVCHVRLQSVDTLMLTCKDGACCAAADHGVTSSAAVLQLMLAVNWLRVRAGMSSVTAQHCDGVDDQLDCLCTLCSLLAHSCAGQ
jgi:hypothetical protein